jgi:hypothetical protein
MIIAHDKNPPHTLEIITHMTRIHHTPWRSHTRQESTTHLGVIDIAMDVRALSKIDLKNSMRSTGSFIHVCRSHGTGTPPVLQEDSNVLSALDDQLSEVFDVGAKRGMLAHAESAKVVARGWVEEIPHLVVRERKKDSNVIKVRTSTA